MSRWVPTGIKCCDRFRGFELPYDDPAGYPAPPAFGPYRVLHQIGSGALGPVFRSFEPLHEQLIAVKAFRLAVVPEDAARLADALRRLAATPVASPRLVPAVGAGLEGATPFLASEFVAVDTLDVAMRRLAPMPLDRARPLLRQMAEALEAGWHAGLAHGALHPRDVFVDGDLSSVRISGVGVAAAVESVGARTLPRRPYAAPERVAGAPADHRSDVYSLAVIAHELLTGRRPAAAGEQDGALPSTTSPEQRVAIRRALAAALAESPAARFASATEFVDALETGDVPDAVVTVPVPATTVAEPVAPLEVLATASTDTDSDADVADADEVADEEAEGAEAGAHDAYEAPLLSVDDVPMRAERDVAPTETWPHAAFAAAPRSDRPSTAWALIVIGIIIGCGFGYWWRGSQPSSDVLPERTVADANSPGTDVIVDTPQAPAQTSTPPAAVTEPAVQEPDTTRGRLLVRSVPEGARVLVSGRPRGVTPAVIRDLPFGTYQISVNLDGYRSGQHRVTLSRTVPARDVTFELTPAAPVSTGRGGTTTGTLDISTRPTGARVMVGGRAVGTTPVRVPELSPGSHTIRLEMDGYRPVTTTVVVRAGQVVPVRVSLERM